VNTFPLHQTLELRRARGRHGYEPQSTLTLPSINPVEHEHVQVYVEIQSRPEALDQVTAPV
jgi:hypothetical protein